MIDFDHRYLAAAIWIGGSGAWAARSLVNEPSLPVWVYAFIYAIHFVIGFFWWPVSVAYHVVKFLIGLTP